MGTGLNTPPGYADRAVALLATHTGHPFRRAGNPFSAQATLDPLVRSHGALKSTAVTLFKIANDLRWMASGPTHGLHELDLPEHEAGSSMMPGKVNPTQAEATLMACLQVIGQDTTVAMAGAEGNFELNAFRPVVISNYLRSARLLADTARCLGRFLVHDVEVVRHTATANLSHDPVASSPPWRPRSDTTELPGSRAVPGGMAAMSSKRPYVTGCRRRASTWSCRGCTGGPGVPDPRRQRLPGGTWVTGPRNRPLPGTDGPAVPLLQLADRVGIAVL